MKMAKFETKNTLFWYLWARIFKKLFPYLKSVPSNLSICKISQKKKQSCLNLGLKMPYLGIFGLVFLKILSNLKSVPFNLSTCKILPEKQKCLNLKPKMPYFSLGYFWARILKNYCDI